ARDLKISPSRLSEILNRKQGLSRRAAEKISDHLGYGSLEKNRFCDLVEAEHARSEKARRLAKIRLKKYAVASDWHELRHDAFRAISDWYHLAILELTQTEGFKNCPYWIAKSLRISEIEATLAIDRLIRLRLLVLQDGQLKVSQNDGFIPGDVPSAGIKKFHKQILAKAADSLYSQ